MRLLKNGRIADTKIRYILITHLHIDHIFDIPLLLYGIKNKNINQKITFIGNKYLKRTIYELMKIGQPNSYKSILNNLNINYIRNDNLIDFNLNNKYKISSFKVIHGELKNCYGYRKDRKWNKEKYHTLV